jgi:aryl-alcohol dehydrogenase-like predicted oxidoreductase
MGTGDLARVEVGNGVSVSRIGYGAMQLTGPHVWGEYPDRDGGIALLRGAVDLGIDFIDTADVYGPHTNELLIRDALRPYPEHLVIATKGGFVRGGYDYATLGQVGNVNYLRQCVHGSLRRLGLDAIDLYYLHSGRATDAPFEDQVGALAELKDQGLIKNIGLSNITLAQLRTAQDITHIAAVTALYNVSLRLGADLLNAATAGGLMFAPWHPVKLSEAPHGVDGSAPVARIAAAHAATRQQVALAWQLRRSPTSVPIPGTTSLAHLASNLAGRDLQLDDAEYAEITSLAPEPS